MSDTQKIPASDPRLRWMGRVRESSRGVGLGFPGVSLVFRVRGETVAIDLHAGSADCAIEVSIDGGDWKKIRLDEGEARVTVADRLAGDVSHEVRVVRCNESWEGVLEVRGIVLPANAALLEAPRMPDRRLLFIGDSITVGSANECLPPDFVKAPRGTNANKSFGMELGRRLDAQVHLVACGGRGLIRDWLGNDNTKTNNAPVFFELAMPDDPSAKWDHSRYTPQVIVIGLGANDFSVGIPEESVWVSAGDAFLKRIRQVHPRSHVILTNSPDFSNRKDNGDFAKAAALEHYLDGIIHLSRDRGDTRVEKVLLQHQPGTEHDSHPTTPQHLLIADDLEPAIRRVLGEAGHV